MLGGFWFTDLLIERSGYEPSEPSQGLCCDLRQDTLQKTVDTNKSSGKPEGRTLGWLSSWSLERFFFWGGGGVCNLLTKKLASTESGLPVAHPHAMVIFADSGLVILAV